MMLAVTGPGPSRPSEGKWRVGLIADSNAPTASVDGAGELNFEPFRDMEGKPRMLVDAAFAMGPRLGMGSSSGHVEAFGVSFDSSWGELSEVQWAS